MNIPSPKDQSAKEGKQSSFITFLKNPYQWLEEFEYWVETIARFMIDATDYYVKKFVEEIKNE